MTNQTHNASDSNRILYRLCFSLAVVACSFSLLVGVLMISNLLTVRTASPLNLQELSDLQSALKANPTDDAIRDKIRDLDFVIRNFYFGGLHSLQSGSFLLLGGMTAALLSLKGMLILRRRPLDPRELPAQPDPARSAATLRWATGATAIVLISCALFLGLRLGETPRPTSIASPAPTPLLTQLAPDAATHWPSFRGQSGSGATLATNVPITWDCTTGTGLLWKAPIPLPGLSSPIVWGNKIFLTGASAEKREVYCYDLNTGTLLWQMTVPSNSASPKNSPEVNQDTGYAASTPVTDGIRIYSIFANGDVAAIDHCSTPRWTVDLGTPVNRYGYASSLAIFNNLILIQYDNETDKGGISQLIALDAATGKRIWTTPRPVADAWPSPVLIQTATGPQLVTAANEWIIAYTPATGTELWRVKVTGTDSSASPIFAGGLVLVSIAGDKVYAIRPDGRGDVTATHIAWQSDSGISDVASPVSNGELAFFVTAGGALTCLEVATGKLVWEHSLEGEFYASPGLAGDRLYLVARSGQVFIIHAGRTFDQIGTSKLGEPSDGSPVFINGKILIRGIKTLFCIGEGH